MSQQAPGFFTTARHLFSGASGSIIQTLKLGEDLASTARLTLVPTQVDSMLEAKASLAEAKMTLEDFRKERFDLLS